MKNHSYKLSNDTSRCNGIIFIRSSDDSLYSDDQTSAFGICPHRDTCLRFIQRITDNQFQSFISVTDKECNSEECSLIIKK